MSLRCLLSGHVWRYHPKRTWRAIPGTKCARCGKASRRDIPSGGLR